MVKPGYKQTELGVIPEDWKIKKLINLSDGGMQNGTFYESARKGTGVYFLNVGNLYETAPISPHTLEKFDASKDEIDRFRIKNGDLFFTRSSIVPSGIAYCNWYKDTGNCVTVFDSHVVRFKTDTEQVDPMYLYLQCISQESRKYFISNAKVATMTTIDQAQIGNCLIPVPSLGEQASIAEVVSNAGSMIDLLKKLIAKKKAIKQGAMQELLTGKKRLPGFSGEITYQPLKSLCTVFSDGDWIESKDQSSDGIRLIQTGNVGNGRYIDKQEKQRFISVDTFNRLNCLEIFEGDVLISRLPDPAGRACILPPSNKRRITAVDCTVVRFSSYNPVLFVAYSQTKLYQEKVEMAMAGSTRQRISRKELGEIPIPVFPTIEEQNTVASIFANMDAEIEALEQKLAKYRQVKQGMMQQLLTGKIRLV